MGGSFEPRCAPVESASTRGLSASAAAWLSAHVLPANSPCCRAAAAHLTDCEVGALLRWSVTIVTTLEEGPLTKAFSRRARMLCRRCTPRRRAPLVPGDNSTVQPLTTLRAPFARRIAAQQASLLAAAARQGPRAAARAAATLRPLVGKAHAAALLPRYLSHVSAAAAAAPPQAAVAPLAAALAAEITAASDAAARSTLLEACARFSLAGQAPLPPALLALFHPLLESATRDEAAAVLAPAAVRALKRSPESSAASVGALLRSLSVDFGAEHASLLQPLLSAARSAKEEVRSAASAAVAALAARAAGAAARPALVQQCCAVLGGSEGRIKEVPQRCATWSCLGARQAMLCGCSAAILSSPTVCVHAPLRRPAVPCSCPRRGFPLRGGWLCRDGVRCAQGLR